MCLGLHWLLLENLGEHSDHHNVVVFFRIWTSECWCSPWHSSGFIIYECMMSFWVYPMHASWFSRHYSYVVSFAQTSESCWINFFQICIGLCAGERIMILQLQAHAFGRFAWYCTIPNLIRVHLWLIRTRSLFLLCFLTFHLLYCSQYKACAELNILTIRMFHLFSLRVICKICIWCNQS